MMSRHIRAILSGAVLTGCLSMGALAQSARDEQPGDRPEPPRPGVNRPDGNRPEGARPDENRPDGNRPEGPRGPERFGRVDVQVRPLQMERRLEKAAYLGVTASPAPAALRQQLSLPAGIGLVVDTIAEKSPAADAGLKSFDVIHKLNDQLVVNQQQLAVLVRTFKGGDSIKLTVVREGKPTELSVKLVERDLPPLDDLRFGMNNPFPQFDMQQLPMPVLPGPNGGNPADVFIDRRPFQPNMLNEDFTIAWDDGTISMTITGKNDNKTLVAKDRDGKELFNGPINTPEEREKLPPQVKERLPQIGMPGVFRFNGRPGEGRPGEMRPGDGRPNPDGQRPELRPNGPPPGDRRSPSTRPARQVIERTQRTI